MEQSAQKYMENRANFHAIDVSAKVVRFCEYRASLLGVKIQANVASALNIPFPNEYFDSVVSLGCFHHTGNLEKAINEVLRVLKPGGTLHLMVYSSHSHL